MKIPGRAWLQFETTPGVESGAELTQIAFYAPKGLSGLLYWYIQYPIHAKIFSGLITGIADRAEGNTTLERD
jgi:hypothetical protein